MGVRNELTDIGLADKLRGSVAARLRVIDTLTNHRFMAGTERQRELRRRRSRTKKVNLLKAKAVKANKSERDVIINKLRRLTPGASQLIESMQLKS